MAWYQLRLLGHLSHLSDLLLLVLVGCRSSVVKFWIFLVFSGTTEPNSTFGMKHLWVKGSKQWEIQKFMNPVPRGLRDGTKNKSKCKHLFLYQYCDPLPQGQGFLRKGWALINIKRKCINTLKISLSALWYYVHGSSI